MYVYNFLNTKQKIIFIGLHKNLKS
jgi:hypothetical protein